MRSDLIFGALTHVNNRYQLCQLAAKATRKLHKPNTRLQDTTNEVLDRFKDTVPMNDGTEPEVEKIYAADSPGAPRGLVRRAAPAAFVRGIRRPRLPALPCTRFVVCSA